MPAALNQWITPASHKGVRTRGYLMELRLNSPVGGSPAVYRWPLSKKRGYDESKEIIETIIWGCKDIPDLEVPLKRNILKNVDVNNFESMKALTKRYNKAINNILSLEKGTQKFCNRLNQLASKDLLHHIIQQTYSAAVTNAEELNKYQAFSPDVYGETSFDLIAQMIDHINLTKDDVFIDLGSGVGQVILQVAATSLCKVCIGIERADVPARYAKAMESKFIFWMQWYGKKHGPFQLIKDDFFDESHREKISEATVIFVNNFAFGPSVDHKLKQRFAELKHGTKIVSSRSFCPLNFRITDRNLSDVGTIMNITKITPSTSSVSWTDKPVSYYLQEIDRTKLENYFNAKKNGTLQIISEDVEKSSDSCETNYDRQDNEANVLTISPRKKKSRKCKIENRLTYPSPEKSMLETNNEKMKCSNQEIIASQSFCEAKNGSQNIYPNNLRFRKSSEPQLAKMRGKKRKHTSMSLELNSSSRRLNCDLTYSGRINSVSPTPRDTRMQRNLKRLLSDFRCQYLQMMDEMSDPLYEHKIRKHLESEVIKNVYLKMRVEHVNQEIENIILDMQSRILQATFK